MHRVYNATGVYMANQQPSAPFYYLVLFLVGAAVVSFFWLPFLVSLGLGWRPRTPVEWWRDVRRALRISSSARRKQQRIIG